ncbi:hypothetical protein CsSME_00040456 [Camellia sinensis var. sinensis]
MVYSLISEAIGISGSLENLTLKCLKSLVNKAPKANDFVNIENSGQSVNIKLNIKLMLRF